MPTISTDIGTLITRTPGLHGGSPHIAGKGVTVRRIALWYKKGLNPEEIVTRIGHLSLAEVYAALAYYHANKEEIEADLAAEAAEAKRLESLHTESKISKENPWQTLFDATELFSEDFLETREQPGIKVEVIE
ncbi:MAG: DUF433 domain-containing protein [Scytonema sp. RU_4_4]|nr:DUF433 domain-containing protein [Scytonema sp. RU_4_4]